MFGTVRMIVVDAVNSPSLNMEIDILQNYERGSWLLEDTLDKTEERESKPKPAESTGNIFVKDKKAVVFYTSDLAETPRRDDEGSSDFKIRCVHLIGTLKRFIGNETMTRTTLLVTSFTVAYKLFMNSVDSLDKFR